MNRTKKRTMTRKITVDIEGLAAMLSCGCASARKIGELAGARIQVGRRVLYSIKKVEEYLEDVNTVS